MTSVVSLRAFANSSSVPIVVFVDMQQEYLAKPRLLAISQIDRALDNCRRVLDHSRSIGLPVAFIRMLTNPPFSIVRRPSSGGSKVLSPAAMKWYSNVRARRAILVNRSPHW